MKKFAIKKLQKAQNDSFPFVKSEAAVFVNTRFGAKSKKYTRGHPVPKAKYKKWNFQDLLEVIRTIVLREVYRQDTAPTWITVEGIGRDLEAKLPLVAKCFMKLNQEGLLHLVEVRDNWDFARGHATHSGGRQSTSTGWMSSIYYMRRKNSEDLMQRRQRFFTKHAHKRFANQIARKEI